MNVECHNNLIKKYEICRLQELEEIITESEFKHVHGIENFFSYIDPDEMLATNEWVFVPTRVSSGSMVIV